MFIGSLSNKIPSSSSAGFKITMETKYDEILNADAIAS